LQPLAVDQASLITMIVLPLLAILLGFLLFWGPSNGFSTDETFVRYGAIAVLAGLDTILGGLRAWGDEAFDDAVFLSGFVSNALLAAGLVAVGEKFGLETGVGEGRISVMMVGVVVVFSIRVFSNLAVLRHMMIDRLRSSRARGRARKSAASASSSLPSLRQGEAGRERR
jgi:small basic protein